MFYSISTGAKIPCNLVIVIIESRGITVKLLYLAVKVILLLVCIRFLKLTSFLTYSIFLWQLNINMMPVKTGLCKTLCYTKSKTLISVFLKMEKDYKEERKNGMELFLKLSVLYRRKETKIIHDARGQLHWF